MTHRKHSHAFGTITLTVTACLLLWGFQLPAWLVTLPRLSHWRYARSCRKLGRNMQAITGAISQEEWVQSFSSPQKLLHTPSHRLLKKCASLLTSALMRPSSETWTRRLTRRRWP
ncbi:Uncharacterised protein [Raoultella terrigena]|uniref:Uncharacterized protein n=1 Tax=Raoultella terrigena TaxID=577 RepID=A0A3P8JYI5_RAOTE|nr:Uncharacterised protein [Raoultella terrigena]